jgi:hypothetical protein
MTYSIFDTGNLVVSFDREDEARDALVRIANEADGPGALMMLTFDDDGTIVDGLVATSAASAH